jgi:ComF family protein
MRNLIEVLLDAVAPRRCLACGEVCAKSWCEGCGEPEPLLDAGSVAGVPIVVAGVYTGSLARAITRFKYEPRPELAAPLGRLLVAVARELDLPQDLVWAPVPLHFERLVERGFNQSALLARELARATRRPLSARLLRRARETGHQVELGRSERAENVREAFQVRASRHSSVALVDDVVTTGATAEACIMALRKKEVRVQAVFALARTANGDARRGPSPHAREHGPQQR